MAAAACIAAAVTLAIVRRTGDVLPAAASGSDHEFRAKSAAPTRTSPGRWAGIQAYYVAAGSAPQRLASQHLPADAGLLFSYTNIGPRPFEFLMIFVTDARGETRWCYPAYEHAGTNPGAIRIRAGAADVPLDALSHLDVAPGPATLHALFMRRSLRVLDVEAWLDEARDRGAPPPWPDVLHQKLDMGVER